MATLFLVAVITELKFVEQGEVYCCSVVCVNRTFDGTQIACWIQKDKASSAWNILSLYVVFQLIFFFTRKMLLVMESLTLKQWWCCAYSNNEYSGPEFILCFSHFL